MLWFPFCPLLTAAAFVQSTTVQLRMRRRWLLKSLSVGVRKVLLFYWFFARCCGLTFSVCQHLLHPRFASQGCLQSAAGLRVVLAGRPFAFPRCLLPSGPSDLIRRDSVFSTVHSRSVLPPMYGVGYQRARNNMCPASPFLIRANRVSYASIDGISHQMLL